jgi:hypothetical protein
MLCFRLPEPNAAQWSLEESSPLTVAGAVAALAMLKASPNSHLAGPSTNEPERGYNRGDVGYVNAAGRVPYLESLQDAISINAKDGR